MPDSTLASECKNPDCEVRTTGVCVNAHQPLEACPDYVGATDTGVESVTEATEPPIVDDDAKPKSEEKNSVALHSGLALDVEGVDQFLRTKAATFVAIIGERDSGKTTLSCAIYDRFLKGPFAGLVFAASHTLVTFEKRAHPSRVESGRVKPDTPRTSLSEGLKFLHLDVASTNNLSNRSSLMLSDRAGEKYKQARGQTQMIEELIEIPHADRVVLLLDGLRLADPTRRAGAVQNVRQMIRALVDNGALNQKSIVQVVTTKIDLIAIHEEKSAIESAMQDFTERLLADFSSRLKDLSFWEISARDPEGNFELAFGVDKLLQDWVKPSESDVSQSSPTVTCKTEFDRLLQRTVTGPYL